MFIPSDAKATDYTDNRKVKSIVNEHVTAPAPVFAPPKPITEIHKPADINEKAFPGDFVCQRKDCTFRRHFGTYQGALIGISKHLMSAHRIKMVI